MPRITSGSATHRKKKRILNAAKGYRGGRSKLYRTAKESVNRALAYSYRDRKRRKRDFRRLWIVRINAAARKNGLSYNRFMEGLQRAEVEINRKVLADLAISHPEEFSQLTELAKDSLKS
jgi:large subunit ribosomal protein L20